VLRHFLSAPKMHQYNKNLQNHQNLIEEKRFEKKEVKDAFRVITESVAHVRRLAKDSLLNIYETRTFLKNLEDANKLIEKQIDQHSGILLTQSYYEPIHEYKNMVISFIAEINKMNNSVSNDSVLKILRDHYSKIDSKYFNIIKKLAEV